MAATGVDPERIRLLQFLPVFAIGGTERHVMNLTMNFDRTRFDLSFGCLMRWGEFLPQIEALRIPVADYAISRLYGPRTLRQQLRFSRLLRRNRIDVVHTNNFYANCFAIPAAWLARTAVIVATIQDTGAYLTSRQKRVQRLICRLADVVLVNAEAVRQWLIGDGYPPDKVVVIRNGLDLSRFGRPRTDPGVRQELRVSPDVPIIAMLARVDRLKGVEYFIDAAAAIAVRFPDAHFLVVGDAVTKDGTIAATSDYRSELENQIRRLGLSGRVIFTGFRMDVPELLSEITVSVLPSLSEGLSNTIVESMAAGLPIVATRVGGTPELIEDGVSGLLVPPRDAAGLAAAIGRTLEDRTLAARLGQAARRRAAEHFSLERMVRETERLYSTLLIRARRRGTWATHVGVPSCYGDPNGSRH